MKKLLNVLIILSFLLGLKLSAAPFYKVRCYDAKGKRVSCESKTAKKKVRKKYTKKKRTKRYTKRKPKVNKEALALQSLKEETSKLKEEVEALRKANLIAAAKKEETPDSTVQLADATATPVPVPTAKVEVVEEKDTTPSPLAFAFWVAATKDVKDDKPFGTTVALDINYKFNKNYNLILTAPFDMAISGANGNDFSVGDVSLTLIQKLFKNERGLSIDAKYYAWFPTSSSSRSVDKYVAFRIRPIFKQTFHDGKSHVRVEPEVNFSFQGYKTAAPTATNPSDLNSDNSFTGDNGLLYEKLSPNEKYSVKLKTRFVHNFTDNFGLGTFVKVSGQRKYDYALGGVTQQGGWTKTVQFGIPKFYFSFDNIYWEIGLITTGNVEGFAPFKSDENNSLAFNSYLEIGF
jgi:hypothetical protein